MCDVCAVGDASYINAFIADGINTQQREAGALQDEASDPQQYLLVGVGAKRPVSRGKLQERTVPFCGRQPIALQLPPF